MNEVLLEINRLLSAARSESSGSKVRDNLSRAIGLTQQLKQDSSSEPWLLKADVFATAAIEENDPRARSEYWKRCLDVCDKGWKKSGAPVVADRSAIYAVDCFQDNLSDFEQQEKVELLAGARRTIEEALRVAKDDASKATLLTRKSSVMRHQSLAQFTWPQKRQVLGECLRCTDLARKLNPNFGVFVEAGQANWAYARHEEDDARYAERLREAEQFLKDGAAGGDEFAQLTLARFYRLNFDALDACNAFPRGLVTSRNFRERLRDSYVFGEAVVHLWYQEYPSEILRPLLSEAKLFLETALSAGYNIARIAIALAFVTALLDSPREGEAVLAEMFGDSNIDPWQRAMQLMATSSPSTPLAHGLALGIDQSPVWQSLGTYARRILRRNDLAEQFYRRSLALNERNAVAHTNLARVLIDRSAFAEARRALNKAKVFSDRRFFWWKTVLDDLDAREGVASALEVRQGTPLTPLKTSLFTLLEISHRFESLLSAPDSQRRGYLLEELFIELARLNFQCVVPRYRIKTPGVLQSEVDAYFEHRGLGFRVECKWQTNPAEPDQIVLFSNKLDVANAHGLFLSISGFTSSAIEKTRELCRLHPILLMDGNEAELVFRGRVRLDAAVSKKLSHLMCRSEPYLPVTAEQFG